MDRTEVRHIYAVNVTTQSIVDLSSYTVWTIVPPWFGMPWTFFLWTFFS